MRPDNIHDNRLHHLHHELPDKYAYSQAPNAPNNGKIQKQPRSSQCTKHDVRRKLLNSFFP